MKVILYMAMSVNGMIAKSDDDTDWISGEEWRSYSRVVQHAGCLIVGRRTYHILTKQSGYEEIKDATLVVVSKQNDVKKVSPEHLVANSPKEALELLKDFDEVIVAGGGMLNASFLEENLVDEMFIDIEPIVLGKGIALFEEGDFERRLKLLGTKKISENELQLHYKVIK